MNSLLEMTNGQTTVDHFVSSKPEGEQGLEMNVDSGAAQSNLNGTGHHSNHHSSHHSNNHVSFNNVFYEASMQKTNNFRTGIAYNPAPLNFEKPKPASPVKPKSNMSTFKMISISEESRLSSYPSKRAGFRKNISMSNSRSSKTPIK